MTEDHEHMWELSTLGLGREHCIVEGCGYSRPRRPRDGQVELCLQSAERGFRDGAMKVAELLDSRAAEATSRGKLEAETYRSAAQHARLIARGRDP
jgi:hypothetical protein